MRRAVFAQYISLLIICYPMTLLAAQSFYCPQNQAYINIGMMQNAVLSACGEPKSRQQLNNQVSEQVPVTQLIYSGVNQGAIYTGLNNMYRVWSLPSSNNNNTSGINLVVSIANDTNTIMSIQLNGSNTNSISVCGGTSVSVGDPGDAAYSACGTPASVNNTYINKPISRQEKPEIWTYQLDQYQPAVRLTFIGGQLQSID